MQTARLAEFVYRPTAAHITQGDLEPWVVLAVPEYIGTDLAAEQLPALRALSAV